MKRRKPRQAAGVYSLLDELAASPTAPLSLAEQNHHLIPMLDAMRALEQDQEPKLEHWRAIADAVNMLETLVEMGVCAPDEAGLLDEAAKAMGEAGMRHLHAGVAIRLSGSGIQALRAVLASYTDAVPLLPARVMVQCYRRTEKRIAAIQRGAARPQDVVVKL